MSEKNMKVKELISELQKLNQDDDIVAQLVASDGTHIAFMRFAIHNIREPLGVFLKVYPRMNETSMDLISYLQESHRQVNYKTVKKS